MGILAFVAALVVFSSCGMASSAKFTEFVYPNFTASNFVYVDASGAFLSSRNGTFNAAMCSPQGSPQAYFYLCIVHVASGEVVWTANRRSPVSNTGTMYLTSAGIRIVDEGGGLVWSTPVLASPVRALMLHELGNLILLGQSNNSLWESFENPTDTIVMGQQLVVGTYLSAAVSGVDLLPGDYTVGLSTSDAVLQWLGKTYWKLSMSLMASVNSNSAVDYMMVNTTGLYLMGSSGTVVVVQVTLGFSSFRIARLESSGVLTVRSFTNGQWKQDLLVPSNPCEVPDTCGRIGLCSVTAGSNLMSCSCPANFHQDSGNKSGCLPLNDSYTLYSSCSSTSNSTSLNLSSISFVSIGLGYDYFTADFSGPTINNVNLSVCQSSCLNDCSCLGLFYRNSSGSCYWIENKLGSVMSSVTGEDTDLLGLIKVVNAAPLFTPVIETSGHGETRGLPIAAVVVIPVAALCLMIALGLLVRRRWKMNVAHEMKTGHQSMYSSDELDAFHIPGLPKCFDLRELEVATDNFKTKIGCGGFGSVYKGILPDKTMVAVKKITNLGLQGKREFCTEIAIIGNIHHVNLVKLKGFCVHGRARLLVYEYMNRGSLNHILFGNGGPVLEWQERFAIAIGTARGLAYLHSGCEHKIIHCDIKPENILLHDHFQAKISDFGLSKLLAPEQSSLFTTMRGTRGYLAPEWLTNSAISEKTDVYSFGMVLLEIVRGRKNCLVRTQSHSLEANSGGEGSSLTSATELEYFPLIALEMHEQQRYLELADPRLENRVTSEEVEKLVRVALCCVHEEPSLRPNMVTVVGMLEGGIPLGKPRIESLNFLRFFGRRFTESSTIRDDDEHDTLLYHQVNAYLTSTASSSPLTASYISSQQVSGPR
ncbi:hypothetical protein MLD38_033989 [Melastoma candidum]|uniref:Uncharacterized protein n=1 Tax=Melastoma candidum TaxID=119954 RepID=A0ACB9M8B2_9MYRT|nr:hypothetical protein MLD38_033989 [Melastoma candidum]